MITMRVLTTIRTSTPPMKGRLLKIGLRMTLTVLRTDTCHHHFHIIIMIMTMGQPPHYLSSNDHHRNHLLNLAAHALEREDKAAVAAVHQVQVDHHLQCNNDHQHAKYEHCATSSSWVFFSYTLTPPSLGGTFPSPRWRT